MQPAPFTFSMPTAWEPWPGNRNAIGVCGAGADAAAAFAPLAPAATASGVAGSSWILLAAAFLRRRSALAALRSTSSCALRMSSAEMES